MPYRPGGCEAPTADDAVALAATAGFDLVERGRTAPERVRGIPTRSTRNDPSNARGRASGRSTTTTWARTVAAHDRPAARAARNPIGRAAGPLAPRAGLRPR